MHRALLIFVAVLLTAPQASASQEQEADDAVQVPLEWESPAGEDHTFRVYRDGTLIHVTGSTSYVDTLAPDPLTGLFHAQYLVTVEAGNVEQPVQSSFVAGSQPCPILGIATNFTEIPFVSAGVNFACVPWPPSIVEEFPPDGVVFRLFH